MEEVVREFDGQRENEKTWKKGRANKIKEEKQVHVRAVADFVWTSAVSKRTGKRQMKQVQKLQWI